MRRNRQASRDGGELALRRGSCPPDRDKMTLFDARKVRARREKGHPGVRARAVRADGPKEDPQPTERHRAGEPNLVVERAVELHARSISRRQAGPAAWIFPRADRRHVEGANMVCKHGRITHCTLLRTRSLCVNRVNNSVPESGSILWRDLQDPSVLWQAAIDAGRACRWWLARRLSWRAAAGERRRQARRGRVQASAAAARDAVADPAGAAA